MAFYQTISMKFPLQVPFKQTRAQFPLLLGMCPAGLEPTTRVRHEETERGGGVEIFLFWSKYFPTGYYFHSFTLSLILPFFQVSENLTMLTYVKIQKIWQNYQLWLQERISFTPLLWTCQVLITHALVRYKNFLSLIQSYS